MTDFYVKPFASGAPDGSGTTASPWNGLTNINWGGLSGGDTLYGFGGTYTGESLVVANTFSAASPLTIRALNRRTMILDGGGTVANGLLSDGKEGIHLREVEIKNYTSLGVSMLAQTVRGPDGCHVIDCYVHDCDGGGISIGFPSGFQDVSATAYNDIEVRDCLVEDVGGRGISVQGGCTGAVISNNVVNRAVQGTVNAWGIYSAGDHVKHLNNSALPSWTNTSGDIWKLSLGATNYSSKSIQAVQFNGRTTSGDYHLTDAGAGTSPSTDEFTVDGTDLYIDSGGDDPNGKTVVLVFAYCTNITQEFNTVSDTGYDGGTLDGVGMGFDHGVQDSTIRGSTTYDNPGPGLSFNTAEDCTVYGLHAYSNAEGLNISTVKGTTKIYNNATELNTGAAYKFNRLATAHTIDFRGNAAREATFSSESSIDGTLTQDYNHGQGASGGNSVDGTPKYWGGGRTGHGTAGFEAGVSIAGFHDTVTDQDNILFRSTPDIGRQANLISTPTATVTAEQHVTIIGANTITLSARGFSSGALSTIIKRRRRY